MPRSDKWVYCFAVALFPAYAMAQDHKLGPNSDAFQHGHWKCEKLVAEVGKYAEYSDEKGFTAFIAGYLTAMNRERLFHRETSYFHRHTSKNDSVRVGNFAYRVVESCRTSPQEHIVEVIDKHYHRYAVRIQ